MYSKPPTAAEKAWRDYFEYDNGLLIYKKRNPDDYEFKERCAQFNTIYAGKVAGSIETPNKANTSYFRIQLLNNRYWAHRIVWEMHNGKIPDGMVIDHINRNGLDNRIENLRCVYPQVNSTNRKVDERNTSGVTGVTWCKQGNAWKATISDKRKRIHIGNFQRFENAATARYFMEYFLGYRNNEV